MTRALAPLNERRPQPSPRRASLAKAGYWCVPVGPGFRFQRQVLFGKESIALRQQAAKQRRLRHLERSQRVETEAAARRALEQDEMHEVPEE